MSEWGALGFGATVPPGPSEAIPEGTASDKPSQGARAQTTPNPNRKPRPFARWRELATERQPPRRTPAATTNTTAILVHYYYTIPTLL